MERGGPPPEQRSGALAPIMRVIIAHTEHDMVNYYPLRADFSVKHLDEVASDLRALVAAYRRRAIHLAELGMPAGKLVGSSTSLQASFITRVFASWDKLAMNIKRIEFTWLHDQDESAIAEVFKLLRHTR